VRSIEPTILYFRTVQPFFRFFPEMGQKTSSVIGSSMSCKVLPFLVVRDEFYNYKDGLRQKQSARLDSICCLTHSHLLIHPARFCEES